MLSLEVSFLSLLSSGLRDAFQVRSFLVWSMVDSLAQVDVSLPGFRFVALQHLLSELWCAVGAYVVMYRILAASECGCGVSTLPKTWCDGAQAADSTVSASAREQGDDSRAYGPVAATPMAAWKQRRHKAAAEKQHG